MAQHTTTGTVLSARADEAKLVQLAEDWRYGQGVSGSRYRMMLRLARQAAARHGLTVPQVLDMAAEQG